VAPGGSSSRVLRTTVVTRLLLMRPDARAPARPFQCLPGAAGQIACANGQPRAGSSAARGRSRRCAHRRRRAAQCERPSPSASACCGPARSTPAVLALPLSARSPEPSACSVPPTPSAQARFSRTLRPWRKDLGSPGTAIFAILVAYFLGQVIYVLTYPLRAILGPKEEWSEHSPEFKDAYMCLIEQYPEFFAAEVSRYRSLARFALAMVVPSLLIGSSVARVLRVDHPSWAVAVGILAFLSAISPIATNGTTASSETRSGDARASPGHRDPQDSREVFSTASAGDANHDVCLAKIPCAALRRLLATRSGGEDSEDRRHGELTRPWRVAKAAGTQAGTTTCQRTRTSPSVGSRCGRRR